MNSRLRKTCLLLFLFVLTPLQFSSAGILEEVEKELVKLAGENPQIFLVVGDLGFSVVEPFAEKFPNRFINAGVAEQNMAGLASGLALNGFHVF